MSDKLFLFRLLPPRADFAQTMTPEEQDAMARHAAYWRGLLDAGRVVVYGPVADPEGVWGLGVVRAGSQAEVVELGEQRPGNRGRGRVVRRGRDHGRHHGVRILRQRDGVSCGPAVAVVAGARLDPDYAAVLTDDRRFADEQRRVHATVNRVWPRRLGLTPAGMARALSAHRPYRWRLFRGRRDTLADVATAVRPGHRSPC